MRFDQFTPIETVVDHEHPRTGRAISWYPRYPWLTPTLPRVRVRTQVMDREDVHIRRHHRSLLSRPDQTHSPSPPVDDSVTPGPSVTSGSPTLFCREDPNFRFAAGEGASPP